MLSEKDVLHQVEGFLSYWERLGEDMKTAFDRWVSSKDFLPEDVERITKVLEERMVKTASLARILNIDDAEFYIVCPDCYELHRHEQWSGSTRLPASVARRLRKQALAKAKKCELCGRPLVD